MASISVKPRGTGRPRVVHWYRTDLRVHDSPSLAKALELDPETLTCVWTWDPAYVYSHRVGHLRWSFLLESMQVLSDQLAKINPDQRLVVLKGQPTKVWDWVFKEWEGVTHLVYEVDTSAYALERDQQVLALAASLGITVVPVLGHTLYDAPSIIKKNSNAPTMTVAQWGKAAAKLPSPPLPLPIPASLPPMGPIPLPNLGFLPPTEWTAPLDINSTDLGGYRTSPPTCFLPPLSLTTTIPTPESLSLPPRTEPPLIPGGEIVALARLEKLPNNQEWIAGFSKPNSSPAAVLSDFVEGEVWRSEVQGGVKGKGKDLTGGSTTVLSMFLKFGCLSVRTFYHSVDQAIKKYEALEKKDKKIKITTEPENLIGQLKFREMYICAEYAIPHFERVRGNNVCRYIGWKCETKFDKSGAVILPRPRDEDEEAEKFLEAWTHGRTGFPWIDALMRQLRQTGWIHHLGRHSVACFLTRGQGYISWERGAEVFDELLLDWDPAANAGNWMWLSCSAFYSMYYRVYSPVAFPKKYDATGALVRKFCPELKDFPDKYIYEPHLAPLAVQKKANCIIGKDYPSPICDAKKASDLSVAKIKSAFAVNFHGNSPEVLDGSADQIIADAYRKSSGSSGSATGSKKGGEGGGEELGEKRLNPWERIAEAKKQKGNGGSK